MKLLMETRPGSLWTCDQTRCIGSTPHLTCLSVHGLGSPWRYDRFGHSCNMSYFLLLHHHLVHHGPLWWMVRYKRMRDVRPRCNCNMHDHPLLCGLVCRDSHVPCGLLCHTGSTPSAIPSCWGNLGRCGPSACIGNMFLHHFGSLLQGDQVHHT